MARLALTLSDYNRIYQVAHGVLNAAGKVENPSVFFASFGSMMLNKHFKVPARPVAGAFALCIDDLHEVAAFGKLEGNALASDETGFHTWVQTESHIIDFMAPIYREAFAKQSFQKPIERRMFQRPRAEQATTVPLTKVGEFIVQSNPALTDRLLTEFLAKPQTRDLMQIGEKWFGRRSGKQKPTSVVTNDIGTSYGLRIPDYLAHSVW
jgi:hypothetical protein